MSVESDLRLKLSAIEPKIQNIVTAKQHQPSHKWDKDNLFFFTSYFSLVY